MKNLLGHNFIIPRDSSESIMTLKYKIEEIAEIDVDSIRLIFQGKQLEDNRTLEDYNIVKGSIIHIVLRLR